MGSKPLEVEPEVQLLNLLQQTSI